MPRLRTSDLPALPKRRLGFTLVELTVVVLILGIIAAIAAPRVFVQAEDARGAILHRNRIAIQDTLDRQLALTGAYPTSIDPAWFNGPIPEHPNQPAGVRLVEIVNSPGDQHPDNKVLTESSAGCFWYNYAEGVLRARVRYRGPTETLEFYNKINDAELSGTVDQGGMITLPNLPIL